MAPRRRSLFLRLVLWASTFFGGVLFGMGLFILAQVQLLLFLRQELAKKGLLARTIGELTFPWRSLDHKLALTVGSIPEEYLQQSRATGLCLSVIGLVGLGVLLPLILRRGSRG